MTTPQENPALNAELQRLAQSYVEMAGKNYGLSLDYSEESLRHTDDAIAKFHPDGNALDEMLLPYGAYVGETLRRRLGGVWVQDERGVALIEGVGGLDLKASPFSWAQARFSNGMAEALAAKFNSLKQQVAQAGGKVAASPLTIARPAAATTGGGVSPEDMTIITCSPLVVFMLVAGADGKVDKKELAMFEKVIDVMTAKATPLLRKAMSDMLSELDQLLESLQNTNPVDDLKRLAVVLDTYFPGEAEVFKRQLMGIAVKIAESSGGFLGFGNKMSKKEAATIAGIGVLLGIIEAESDS